MKMFFVESATTDFRLTICADVRLHKQSSWITRRYTGLLHKNNWYIKNTMCYKYQSIVGMAHTHLSMI